MTQVESDVRRRRRASRGVGIEAREDDFLQPRRQVRHVLAQRLEQAGVALSDDEIDELTRQITTGD